MSARRRRIGFVAGTVLALTLAVASSGCASRRSAYRPIASGEPGLEGAGGEPAIVAGAPPSRTVTFADRHPLFSKPREYYEISGENKLVKSAAATFIGVPAGVLGEMRQIVVGQPPRAY